MVMFARENIQFFGSTQFHKQDAIYFPAKINLILFSGGYFSQAKESLNLAILFDFFSSPTIHKKSKENVVLRCNNFFSGFRSS